MDEVIIETLKWEIALVMRYMKELRIVGREIWAEEVRLKDLRARLDKITGAAKLDDPKDGESE